MENSWNSYNQLWNYSRFNLVYRLRHFFFRWKIKFAITDTKRYVPIETLSTLDNSKLLQQLKLGSKKKKINLNKYQSKVAIHIKITYRFSQSGHFALLFEKFYRQNSTHRILSFKSRNKGLQRYGRTTKLFWWAS